MHGHEPLLGTILVPVKPDRHFHLLPWVVAFARGAGAHVRFVWIQHDDCPDGMADEAEKHLAEWMERCAKAGVESSAAIREGTVEDEIVGAVLENGADMVILSHAEDSHRIDSIQRRLLHGEELRSPPCPVVLVPTCDHKEEHKGPPTCAAGQPFNEATVEERSKRARETNPFGSPSSNRREIPSSS
jgi:hypothetical protein